MGVGALDVRASWTYSDFRFRGGEYAGKQIAGVPRQLINAEVLYRIGAWRFGPNVRWMPVSTPTDHANTAGAEQDAYALLGLKLEWRDGPWALYLQADNVTDRRYASAYAIRNQATAAQPGYLQGLGRSFTAGLSYKF
jgi:iron complex outermembrane receptor protein